MKIAIALIIVCSLCFFWGFINGISYERKESAKQYINIKKGE